MLTCGGGSRPPGCNAVVRSYLSAQHDGSLLRVGHHLFVHIQPFNPSPHTCSKRSKSSSGNQRRHGTGRAGGRATSQDNAAFYIILVPASVCVHNRPASCVRAHPHPQSWGTASGSRCHCGRRAPGGWCGELSRVGTTRKCKQSVYLVQGCLLTCFVLITQLGHI